ncbi:hypothetical protein HY358_00170 [Candidatus Roizmanbacteria bacterium]|nr:hypothetical protein [Candidatus Roizmanbacteria bacterium]
MSQSSEVPIGRIVDRETFGFYIVGYTAQIMNTAPRRLFSSDQWDERFGQEPISGLSADRILEFPSPLVTIEHCPWDAVPPSIQQMIQRQYPSAAVGEDQRIDATVSRRDIIFSLTNGFVKGRVDTFGEEYVGRGLLLLFGDEPDDAIIRPGDWRIARFPLSLYARAKYTARNSEPPDLSSVEAALGWMGETEPLGNIMKQLASLVQGVPSTLQQLHDVANLLEATREQVTLYVPEQTDDDLLML